MTIDKALTVDLNRVQPHKVIRIHEGDVNSIFLVLTLTQSGSSVPLSGVTIKYDATIAGYLAEQDATGTISSGKIRIPITSNMTALPGPLKIDVRMVSGTEVLHTQTFTLLVDKSVVDGSTIIDFDGTTIGGRMKALEDGLDEVEGDIETLEAKFPVKTADIASSAVTTAKINNGAVTAAKIASGVIPTKTSDLTNDSGFLTQHQDISGKMNMPIDVPFDDEDDHPNYNTTQFAALLPGQVFQSSTSEMPIRYWIKIRTYNYFTAVEITDYSTLLEIYDVAATIPTKTSDLTNDSGFLTQHQDISGKMNLTPSVPFDDENDWPDIESSQFGALLPGQIFTSSAYVNTPRYWVKYRTQVSSFSYDAQELITDVSGKADTETGTIGENHAWYTDPSQGYTMTGNYTIIGDTCFLRAKAYLIQGWERVYYSLPVASIESSTAVGLCGDSTFSIATSTQNNVSVLEIKQIGQQYMGSGRVSFTLIYKYK